MKKILLSCVFIVLLTSCTKWDVLSPTDGELTVKVLNVEMTFDFENQEVIVLNTNWEAAWVEISRRTDTWCDYLEIFDQYVGGRSEVQTTAYFDHGDKIKINIQINDDNDNRIIRNSYFQLGKACLRRQACIPMIFDDWVPEDFKISQDIDNNLLILEFTLK